eukprot:248148-Ditylum_brightwellii.AAC.1
MDCHHAAAMWEEANTEETRSSFGTSLWMNCYRMKYATSWTMICSKNNPDETQKKRFIIGRIDCSKDTGEILKKTFMMKQHKAFQNICNNKQFVVNKVEDGNLILGFESTATGAVGEQLFDITSR